MSKGMMKGFLPIAAAVCFPVFLGLSGSCSSAPRHFEAAPSMADPSGPGAYAGAENRMVMYQASITMDIKDVDEARKVLTGQARDFGGFVTRDSEDSMSLRIPRDNMEIYLRFIRSLGSVEDEEITGTDITDTYTDIRIRLESLGKIRERYEALLEKAVNVADMLVIERELERVNLQIEQFEGRQKYYEQSVEYSNIVITFGKKARPGPLGWIFFGLYRGLKWLFVWN